MAADTAVPTSIWRAAAATIGTRAIDIPSRYGFHILVAWKLGLVDAGAFYIVFSVLTLAAGAGRLGIDRAMTREVARALAVGDAPQARAAILRGIAIVAGLSLAAGAVMALLAPVLAERLFHNPRLTMPLVLAAIAIVPMCLSAAAGGALAGLHRVALSQMIYSWLWPGLFCLLALPLALTLRNAFLLIIAANLVCAVVAFALLARFRPRAVASGSAVAAPPLMGLGWSLFTSEIVQLLLAALPGLVLGIVASEAVVGAYAMAWRLALVLNLLVVAVAAMASPRFADCGARGDGAGLRRTAALSLGIVLALGLPVLAILLIGAPWFLALFGQGFESGTTAMRVLLLGQAWLMFTATAPELLGMTGHEKAVKGINLAAILIYAPVLVVLSWWLGGTGAALANLIAAIVSGGGAMWLARRLLGFAPPDALMATAREHWAQRRA
jgi:O-antigen/teichoic acid export membrane protein